METMQALVKISPEKAELVSVPVPPCGPQEVLVRVKSAALCGTDLHIFDWNSWAQNAGIRLPFIMGHEFCGDVAAVGSETCGIRPGDKVAGETHIPCGECLQCRDGEQHICSRLKLFGVHRDGCFAQYALIPAVCARKLPDGIPYDVGAIMEPLGTALRAVQEMRVGGARVMVLGCGPIGLFAVSAAACLGAARIFASDVSVSRLEIASRMGAAEGINPLAQDIRQTVLNATEGCGVDIVIEASGNAEALKQSFGYLRKGGRMALIGLPGRTAELDIGRDVVFKEAQIIGIHGRRMFETWTQMENLLVSRKLNVEPVITHVLPLNRWQEGVEAAKRGEACKVIFHPDAG